MRAESVLGSAIAGAIIVVVGVIILAAMVTNASSPSSPYDNAYPFDTPYKEDTPPEWMATAAPTEATVYPVGEPVEAGPSLLTARSNHTATRLLDGRVLIAGGFDASGHRLSSAEIYDPKTGGFEAVGDMAMARSGHAATLLADGRVLIVAGTGQDSVTTELFDPANGEFSPGPNLVSPVIDGTAVQTPGGRVVVVGSPSGPQSPGSIQHLDLTAGSVESRPPTASIHRAGVGLLSDGRIFIAGGLDGTEPSVLAQILDPTSQEITRVPLFQPVYDPVVVGLSEGRALVIGGYDSYSQALSVAQLYDDPRDGGSLVVFPLMTPCGHCTATLDGAGRVVLFGGGGPTSGTFGTAQAIDFSGGQPTVVQIGVSTTTRRDHTATSLNDGRILLVGGIDDHQTTLDSCGFLPAAMPSR